jgi:hypothetical protein
MNSVGLHYYVKKQKIVRTVSSLSGNAPVYDGVRFCTPSRTLAPAIVSRHTSDTHPPNAVRRFCRNAVFGVACVLAKNKSQLAHCAAAERGRASGMEQMADNNQEVETIFLIALLCRESTRVFECLLCDATKIELSIPQSGTTAAHNSRRVRSTMISARRLRW